jgi:glycerate dehydrogenase
MLSPCIIRVMPAKIVVLDGYTLNPGDLTWDGLRSLGELEVHDRTSAADILSRSQGAQVLLTNKTPLRAETLAQLPELKFIGVLATGYDVVDSKVAAERRIPVSNVPTYGTHSVAQFAFALLLELCHRVQRHSDDATSGGWQKQAEWSYHLSPLIELQGKTMGLIGYGRIGRQTGVIARAFGMNVIAADPMLKDEPGVETVSLEDLLRRADAISLHCPLTPETRGIVNAERLSMMKPTAFLLNTARGPLVDEQALADALNNGQIAGAGIDVLPVEPPQADSPLFKAKNCIVTPHIAWATKEARARLMDIAVENVRAFIAGKPVNVVNGI